MVSITNASRNKAIKPRDPLPGVCWESNAQNSQEVLFNLDCSLERVSVKGAYEASCENQRVLESADLLLEACEALLDVFEGRQVSPGSKEYEAFFLARVAVTSARPTPSKASSEHGTQGKA